MSDLEDFSRYYLYVLARKPSTTEKQVERLQGWETLTGKQATSIGPNDVLSYLEQNPKGHSGNTKKGMLSAIQAFHRFEAATGRKKLNGICEIATPSVRDEDSPPPVDLHDVPVLLDACRTPLEYRVIWLPLYAGTRIGESAELHGKAWKEGVLWIKGMKTDRVHPVPVHPELEKKMWDILASRPTDTSTLQKVKRRIAKRTGIRFKAHQLRKRFAQTLSDAGVDKGTRADLLGHRTVEDLYATPNLDMLRGAVERLDYRTHVS